MAEDKLNSQDTPTSRAVHQFLESLGDISPSDTATTATAKPADAKEILNFLDEITSTSNASIAANEGPSNTTDFKSVDMAQDPNATVGQGTRSSGSWTTWGSSLWNQAQSVVKQTTDQIREVASNPETQKKLEERVKGLQNLVDKDRIGKIGNDLRNLTISGVATILETVAPPISEHEVVEVWLSHDMIGYVGVESLVYRAFAKVLEQTEGGDVIVRKGNSNNHHQEEVSEKDIPERELNACESFLEAVKLARANIENLIKIHYQPAQTNTEATPHIDKTSKSPITSPIFLAIQPCLASPTSSSISQLFYVILLQDPTHGLTFESFSQSIPTAWLDVPYEENEWVEDKMVECIRLAVMSIAQDYVWTRMKASDVKQTAALPKDVSDVETKVDAEKELERNEILSR